MDECSYNPESRFLCHFLNNAQATVIDWSCGYSWSKQSTQRLCIQTYAASLEQFKSFALIVHNNTKPFTRSCSRGISSSSASNMRLYGMQTPRVGCEPVSFQGASLMITSKSTVPRADFKFSLVNFTQIGYEKAGFCHAVQLKNCTSSLLPMNSYMFWPRYLAQTRTRGWSWKVNSPKSVASLFTGSLQMVSWILFSFYRCNLCWMGFRNCRNLTRLCSSVSIVFNSSVHHWMSYVWADVDSSSRRHWCLVFVRQPQVNCFVPHTNFAAQAYYGDYPLEVVEIKSFWLDDDSHQHLLTLRAQRF